MRATFKVKSSSGRPDYEVDVFEEHGRLNIFCNCQAGDWNKACKHKAAIIAGEASALAGATPAVLEKLGRVKAVVARTRYVELRAQLDQVEQEAARLKNRKDAIRHAIDKGLSEGFTIDFEP